MMKKRILAASLLLALLPQVLAAPAMAQSGDADPVTAQARARFKEGVDFYDKGQYENARLAFLQAYALKKHPAVLLNLAQSSAKANHPLEASKYFQQFLREATNVTPQQRRDAETGLAEVRQKLGRIEIVAPDGTDVSLDDNRVGTAPFADPVDVEPGPHTLRSSAETVKVIATVGQKVQARFGAGTAAAPPVVAPTAVPATSPAEAPGAGDANATAASQPVSASAASADTGSRRGFRPPATMAPVYGGLAAMGVGVAGAIVFYAFKVDAQSKADQVAAEIRTAASDPTRNPSGVPTQGICLNPPTAFVKACDTLRDNNTKVDTNATVANISIGLAIVGGATALGWYLLGPRERDPAPAPSARRPTRPTLSTYGGLGSGGLVLSGEF